ncbi:MAG TPA: phosphoribosylaminoimidazolesuccinocarboxamide synthase, partial [Acidimicrobiales bacterium]
MKHVYSGKVRDVYEAGDDTLLFVASDRISAFDVVMAEPVPDKGRVLTGMTAFWLEVLRDVAPNHMVSVDPADFPEGAPPDAAGRSMLVRKADMLAIECIVRGYLSGSAWKEYRT